MMQIDSHAKIGLKKEQWEQILGDLGLKSESANFSSERRLWIIDSGASHHMTGTLSSLVDVYRVSPCLVGLPNGKNVVADREGSIVLTENLRLTRVLLVEDLRCSLISVSQLIDELSCIVLFSKTGCLLYDFGVQMVIGTGERREGLYFL